MEIFYAEPKIIRFDINNNLIKSRAESEPIKSSLEPMCWPKKENADKILIGLRIRSHIIQSNTNKEIIGYVFEFLAGVIPKEKSSDKSELKRFVANGILNYQTHFQKNAPFELQNFQLLRKVDEIDLVDKLSDLLTDVGGYSN